MTAARAGRCRLRLLGAFVGVAAVAIAAFAGLILWASRGEVNDLVRRQQQSTIQDTIGVARRRVSRGPAAGPPPICGRRAPSPSAAARMLDVRDAGGGLVFQAGRGLGAGSGAGPGMERRLGTAFAAPQTAPVVVGGKTVGTATFRFPKNALPPAERRLRDALTRTTALGAAIAVAVALLVGFLVADGITRPLRRLTDAVRRLGAGDRSARANLAAPGELGELGAAVDRMAANLEREDELRRALTADVAHELRTPVTILAAQCEAILDGVAEPSAEHLVVPVRGGAPARAGDRGSRVAGVGGGRGTAARARPRRARPRGGPGGRAAGATVRGRRGRTRRRTSRRPLWTVTSSGSPRSRETSS